MKNNIDRNHYIEILLRMQIIRKFEEEVKRLYSEGIIHGTLHLCVGEEAADVGSTFALKQQDYVFTTHRGHGICIGKGADIRAMMAEMLGRKTGTNLGRGGSMHICDIDNGIVGSNGVVGANAPLACGAGLAIRMKETGDCVSVCFTGDGAVNTGAVLESMNLAAVWGLPVIFVLIENHYAVSTTVERASADSDLSKRAIPFGMECFETDGNDVLKVEETMSKARAYAVENCRPCLVIEHTYRISGHSRSDQNKYRTEEEIQYWSERGPIIRFTSQLISEGIMTAGEIDEIEAEAADAVAQAVEYALSQDMADDSVDELVNAVYAE